MKLSVQEQESILSMGEFEPLAGSLGSMERLIDRYNKLNSIPYQLVERILRFGISSLGYVLVILSYPLIIFKTKHSIQILNQVIEKIPETDTDKLVIMVNRLKTLETESGVDFKTLAFKLDTAPYFISPIADQISRLVKKLITLRTTLESQIAFDKNLLHEALDNSAPVGIGFEFHPEFE